MNKEDTLFCPSNWLKLLKEVSSLKERLRYLENQHPNKSIVEEINFLKREKGSRYFFNLRLQNMENILQKQINKIEEDLEVLILATHSDELGLRTKGNGDKNG